MGLFLQHIRNTSKTGIVNILGRPFVVDAAMVFLEYQQLQQVFPFYHLQWMLSCPLSAA